MLHELTNAKMVPKKRLELSHASTLTTVKYDFTQSRMTYLINACQTGWNAGRNTLHDSFNQMCARMCDTN